ncbi:MAG: peptide ligase PGM1-related protein [Parafilimonas sp.]
MNEAIKTNRKSFTHHNNFPPPGSDEERKLFNNLQEGFKKQFEIIFPDKLAPRTVIIVPSFTLDSDILSKVTGILHYEERMLCLLMLLRMPLTKIIYITSVPVPEIIIDYYLHLLPGITGHHARKRLTLFNCFDASHKSLTQKILERPRLLERIKQQITDISNTHLTCFNITPLEKTLAVQLGVPLFGTDPDKFYEGSKSGARKTFKACNINLPDGFEDLHTKDDIVDALLKLKRKHTALKKAVVKMNDGFSGDGNAIFRYPDIAIENINEKNIEEALLQNLIPVAKDVSRELFFEKFNNMGGIVEIFLDGEIKTSPSVQCVINPDKTIDIVSTHDQLLGGDDGQVFIGAIFPADEAYRVSLAKEGKKIAQALSDKGALGRFAIDFLSVQQQDKSWKHFAIEINLRKGGTTHPFLMLQFLTNGYYNADTGQFITASGNERFYFASDNVSNENYKGLTPYDLIDIAMFHSLMYDGAAQEGVMFHLIGALSEFGKLGLVCIGSSAQLAKEFYDKTLEVLNYECC